MPRVCTICVHKQRNKIESAIVSGTSLRDIARQFSVSKDAVSRHAAEHVQAKVQVAQQAKEEAQSLDVVRQLIHINDVALDILKVTRASKDYDLSLKAIASVHKQLELQSKLLGDIDDRAHVQITINPEWLSLRTTIIAALQPYPDAKRAVIEAIVQSEAK
jgi:hypothetical protein